MVYGIFRGEYSDWDVVGYFTDKLEAEKYCAVMERYGYYIEPICDLAGKKDLSDVVLKYTHIVTFDHDVKNDEWVMRKEPDRYRCYIADKLKPNSVGNSGNIWVQFSINLAENKRELAEKIAQDYLFQLLAYGESRKIKKENVDLMNYKFMEPYRLERELEAAENLRKKELAELERLKKKYEGV